MVNALKRHFRPELRAEKISFADPALQGFRAFDPNQRRTLSQKYEERFPRTPVDWHQNKWGSRQATSSKGTYNELDRQLQRQRSGEDLPQAKAQKTLHRLERKNSIRKLNMFVIGDQLGRILLIQQS